MVKSSQELKNTLTRRFDVAVSKGIGLTTKAFVVEVAQYIKFVNDSSYIGLLEKRITKLDQESAKEHERIAERLQKELTTPIKTSLDESRASKDDRIRRAARDLEDVLEGRDESNQTQLEMEVGSLVNLLRAMVEHEDSDFAKSYISLNPFRVDYKNLIPSYDAYLRALTDYRRLADVGLAKDWFELQRIYTGVLAAPKIWKQAENSESLTEKLGAMGYLGPVQDVLDHGTNEMINREELKDRLNRVHHFVLETIERTNPPVEIRNYSGVKVFEIDFKPHIGAISINQRKDMVEKLAKNEKLVDDESHKALGVFSLLWSQRTVRVGGVIRDDGDAVTQSEFQRNIETSPGSIQNHVKRLNGWIGERRLPMKIKKRANTYQLFIDLEKK